MEECGAGGCCGVPAPGELRLAHLDPAAKLEYLDPLDDLVKLGGQPNVEKLPVILNGNLDRATLVATGGGAAVKGAELASVDFEVFRTIMGSFASGVSVVTSLGDDDQPRGMTCSAVCSVSADPPLLLSCVKPPSSTLNAIRTRGLFVVNFLDADGRALSELFASQLPDKFSQVGWRPSELAGMPVLASTLAYAECTVHDTFDAGDHVVVIGRIVGGQVAADRFPLAYWRGKYVRIFQGLQSIRLAV